MIILFSQPNIISEIEIEIINELLQDKKDVFFHFKKNSINLIQQNNLLARLTRDILRRTVIHQIFESRTNFELKGIHYNSTERLRNGNQQAISTSFHALDEISNTDSYEYFFLSPVFDSISKPNYPSNKSLTIKSLDKCITDKAVALGGINSSNLDEVKVKGFHHIALLGTIWHSKNPFQELDRIHSLWQKKDLIV